MNQKITPGTILGIIVACVLGFYALRWIAGPGSDPPSSPSSSSSDERERQAIVSEGKAISSEMDQVNHSAASGHQQDPDRIQAIRERKVDFYKKADNYLTKHGQTPPP